MKMIFSWLESGSKRPAALWLFERLLMVWIIAHAIYHLPLMDIFWGPDSVFKITKESQGLIHNLYYALSYNRDWIQWVFLVHIASALWALVGWRTFIPKILVYITGYMLYYSAYYTFNSGFILCLLWTFYLIPLRLNSSRSSAGLINNLVLIACVIQFLLVYAIAGLTKWTGVDWLEGSALYYSLHLEHYSSEWVRNTFLGSTLVLMIMNYIALVYQTLFPVLIWIKKIKVPLLVVGCLFHVGIVVMLNLWDFGFAMIVGYTLFLEEKWAVGILRRIPRVFLGKKIAELTD